MIGVLSRCSDITVTLLSSLECNLTLSGDLRDGDIEMERDGDIGDGGGGTVKREANQNWKYLAFVDSLMLKLCVSRCACGTPLLWFPSCRAWNISCTKYTVPHINCRVPVSARQKNPCWIAKFIKSYLPCVNIFKTCTGNPVQPNVNIPTLRFRFRSGFRFNEIYKMPNKARPKLYSATILDLEHQQTPLTTSFTFLKMNF